ncbi:MAG TPA: polymer-forming cytoskeletal protein [candidate division Zixibacteria bacterium]|nr:polymer-forming cytoskeletal protein [candidate division Zixibacteria bacterium]
MPKPEAEQKLNTIIGPASRIAGDIEVQGGLRVDGTVEGKIVATGPLTVGQEGSIVAPSVTASSATIGGSVEGDIEAPERIRLEPSARVIGNIITRVLIIEEGAVFAGKSDNPELSKGKE